MFRTIYDPESKIWCGSSQEIMYNPNVSIGQIILHALNKQPNKIGQINDDSDTALTNREIQLRTIMIAQSLIKCGYEKGETIGVVASNGPHLAPTVFAAFLLGIQINPLDPHFGKDDISHMFGLTKPKLILFDANIVEKIQDVLTDIDFEPSLMSVDERIDGISFIEDFFEETGEENLFIPPKIENGANDIALILCSSGTTGLSKGVALSHAQVLDNMTETWEMLTDDIIFCFSSLYWLTGAMSLIFGTILGTTRIISKQRFKPELLFKIIEKYQVTFVLSPPSHLALSLQSPDIHTTDFSSIKSYMCGGAALASRIQAEFQKFLPNGKILCGYGMSEMGGVITANVSKEKLGSIGQLGKNISVKIIDDDGNSLGIGENGELCLKNSYTFIGYYGNPEQTELTKDSDGWIYSGDVGYFDDDGFLFLVDRKKDIMKYQNYQVSPVDIENMILQHEGVGLVCVVGIPDIISTDLPAALIVRANNQKGQDMNEEEIYDLIADNCADFKKLRGGVYFVDSLPMTSSGKYIKKMAKEVAINLFNQINQE